MLAKRKRSSPRRPFEAGRRKVDEALKCWLAVGVSEREGGRLKKGSEKAHRRRPEGGSGGKAGAEHAHASSVAGAGDARIIEFMSARDCCMDTIVLHMVAEPWSLPERHWYHTG